MSNRAEIFNGHALMLRPTELEKWSVWWKDKDIAEVSKTKIKGRYLIELCYSQDGYTLYDEADSLDAAWELLKHYIVYFRM